MLTKVVIRNFKRFGEVEIELGGRVVFIGPNNSGKTSAMQALALWEAGVKQWYAKRSGKSQSEKRKGVAINRRDLLALPHPSANLLWHKRHTRDATRTNGKQINKNVRIDVVVDGIVNNADKSRKWQCGLEFDYANEESFYCRPLRTDDKASGQMSVPEEASKVNVAFLPPMSGLVATETRLDPGAVNVRVGEGRTAEVLRNLCWQIAEQENDKWEQLKKNIKDLFGAELGEPNYISERGEIVMGYREHGTELDLSSSGRGLQQTLLIVAYMYANPGSVILLDEPDAHLEILRQRQVYNLIDRVASESGNQIIAASHSEVLLNEAADRDMVIAFVGKPHRIDDRGSQVRKALAEIGYEQYYQAEQTGWVLYLEGSTDLAILQEFARTLGHEDAMQVLERPFVHYVGNQPRKAENHLYGLREALPHLKGVALYDRDAELPDNRHLAHMVWRQREIESYLCTRATLENYVRHTAEHDSDGMPIFTGAVLAGREAVMNKAITDISEAMQKLNKGDPWAADAKVSDEFLTPLFKAYFDKLELPNLMAKTDFHVLAAHVPKDEIDPEVSEKLDAIVKVAKSARPASDD